MFIVCIDNNLILSTMITYEYTLYQSRRNRKIEAMLRECCFVWNRALALQKRYYRLLKGFISLNAMQKHFAKRPQKFRKAEYFRSFGYKQGGYKLNSNVIVLNTIKQHFQFSFSRPYDGKIKNVRIILNIFFSIHQELPDRHPFPDSRSKDPPTPRSEHPKVPPDP